MVVVERVEVLLLEALEVMVRVPGATLGVNLKGEMEGVVLEECVFVGGEEAEKEGEAVLVLLEVEEAVGVVERVGLFETTPDWVPEGEAVDKAVVEEELLEKGEGRGTRVVLTDPVEERALFRVGTEVLEVVGVRPEVRVCVQEEEGVGRWVGRAEREGVRVGRAPEGVPLGEAERVAKEEDVREGGGERVGEPDTVPVFEDDMEAVVVRVTKPHRVAVGDAEEVLLAAPDRVPEGLLVEVPDEVVVGEEVKDTNLDRVGMGDLEKEGEPVGVRLGHFDRVPPKREAEEVLDRGPEREKVGVLVEVRVVEVEPVVVGETREVREAREEEEEVEELL